MPHTTAIFVLDRDEQLADVCEALRKSGRNFQRIESLAQPDPRSLSRSVLIARPDVLAKIDLSTGDADSKPATLALCDGSVESLLESRARFDDALPWPQGAPQLCDRIDELARRTVARAEALIRRSSAETLTELALGLDGNVDFEDALHEALTKLGERCHCERVLTLAWPPQARDLLYFIGTADDPTAVKIPAPASAYPEIAQLKAGEREVVVAETSVAARVAPYEPQEGTERKQIMLFPVIADGAVFGVVELHFAVGQRVDRPTRDFARQFATLLAPRLYASALYASLKETTRRVALAEVERPDVLRHYEDFFQRAFDGIVVLDEEDKVLYLNPSGEQITGYSRSGLVGTPLSALVVDSDRKRLIDFLDEVRAGTATPNFDVGLITTSGDPILVSIAPSAVLDEQEAMVVSFRDVTEARALADELRATKEFLERLIDSTVDGIIATDMDGAIILFNQGAERITGWREDEVVRHMTLEQLYPPGVADRIIEQLHASSDGGVGRLEMSRKEILAKDGEHIPVSLSASVIYEGGVEVGTVGIISDLRERLRMERRLTQAQEKLIETEKQALIAELAGTTAHELNQPLTSVMGYAELLKKRLDQDEANARAIDTIMGEAQRMADIVRKIGKITRYETKTYVGGTQILDLDKSTQDSGEYAVQQELASSAKTPPVK
ncbi:MAG: PAS domain S-box protein [Myxococcales bacterium]|nr:PAS domain S-box protein [Myxococcales bacterium]